MNYITQNFGIGILSFIVAVILFFAGKKLNKTVNKQTLFILASILFTLFLYETYFFSKTIIFREVYLGSYVGNELLSTKNELLGYGPREDTSFQLQLMKKNRFYKVYDAHYTFENGRRKIPNNNDSSKQHVLFMGCSFILGDGLNDNQTLPYFLNKYAEQTFNSKNYAFSGYGPHQALRLIENKELFDSTESNTLVFLLLPQHISRAAGMNKRDENTPKYIIEDKKLKYAGRFSERKNSSNYIENIYYSSAIYNKLLKPKISQEDSERIFLILEQMNSLLKKKNVRFILLIHDAIRIYDGKNHLKNHETYIYNRIKNSDIEHYYISSVIPNIKENNQNYFIKGDGHPNENYNKELAKFLSNLLLKK